MLHIKFHQGWCFFIWFCVLFLCGLLVKAAEFVFLVSVFNNLCVQIEEIQTPDNAIMQMSYERGQMGQKLIE